MKKVNRLKVLLVTLIVLWQSNVEPGRAQEALKVTQAKTITIKCEALDVAAKQDQQFATDLINKFSEKLYGLNFLQLAVSEAAKADYRLSIIYACNITAGTPPYTEKHIIATDCKLIESKTGKLCWNKNLTADGEGYLTQEKNIVGYRIKNSLGTLSGTDIQTVLKNRILNNIVEEFQQEIISFILNQPLSSWTKDTFQKLLYHNNWKIRQLTAKELGEKVIKEAANWLIDIYKNDSDSDVRRAALESLIKLKVDIAIEPLIVSMFTGDDRKMIAQGLIALDKDGKLIAMAFTWDKDTKTMVRKAEEIIGKEKLLQELIAVWEKRKKILAAEAIMVIEPQKGFNFLGEIIKGNFSTDEKNKALEILINTKNSEAFNLILPGLIEKDEKLRLTVVKFLGETPGTRSIQILQEVIKNDSSEAIRQEAVKALAKLTK